MPSQRTTENQRKRKERQVFRRCQRSKKAVEHEGDSDTNYNWRTWNGSQRFDKETGRLENRRTNRDHQVHHIVEIGQNTEKSPGHLRRLTITQIPVKDYQLTLMGKTCYNNNTITKKYWNKIYLFSLSSILILIFSTNTVSFESVNEVFVMYWVKWLIIRVFFNKM